MYSASFFASAGILAMQWAPSFSFAESVPTWLLAPIVVISGYAVLYRRHTRQAEL